MLYKKKCFTNFAKFIVKHLGQSFFFNKVAGLRPATLLKKILWHRCFSVTFVKSKRLPLSHNTSGQLLPKQLRFVEACLEPCQLSLIERFPAIMVFGWKLPKIAIYLFSQKTPSNVFDRLLIHLFTCFIHC